jgi:hypothetical protein
MVPTTSNARSCSHRERLVSQFQRSLDYYHQTLAARIDKVPVEEAIETTWDIYEACVKARTELHAHEAEHGCLGANGPHSSLFGIRSGSDGDPGDNRIFANPLLIQPAGTAPGEMGRK